MAPIPASTGPVSIGPLHSPDCTAWRAAAFGVEVEAAFAVLGIAPDRNGAPVGSVPGKRVRLELTESGDLDARWQGASPARLFMQPDENGQPWVTLEHDRSTGFMVWTADFGRYLVSSDGRQLVTAPPPVPPAVWQRMLVGHAIPLAGVLQGLELLHASAVALRGAGVAISGPSGRGKTSLAVHLVLRGGELLTDDALALEPRAGQVLAHPGAGVVNLRHGEWERLSPAERDRLGVVIGVDRDAVRVLVTRCLAPVPLRAVLFPQWGAPDSSLRIERVATPAAALLGATFNLAVRSADRLRVQLATCSQVSTSAETFLVSVPPGMPAAGVAAEIDAFLRTRAA